MGYLHIPNLYKDTSLLMFRECYALEKIHGTSAHITYQTIGTVRALKFFSGGESHSRFVGLFNEAELLEKFGALSVPMDKDVTVYGEAYGGSQQGMSHTYGTTLKFIAFDVRIGDVWLSVPDAEQVCKSLGIEFVHYVRAVTDLSVLDALRDAPSEQAIRNGVSQRNQLPDSPLGIKGSEVINARPSEGVVLRPLIELTKNNGDRLIVKHKGDAFKETASPRKVEVDPARLQVLADAEAVANEWVTPMRLEHVLDKIPDHDMTKMRQILDAMVEDVYREGKGEIVESKEVQKAITGKTSKMYLALLKAKIGSK